MEIRLSRGVICEMKPNEALNGVERSEWKARIITPAMELVICVTQSRAINSCWCSSTDLLSHWTWWCVSRGIKEANVGANYPRISSALVNIKRDERTDGRTLNRHSTIIVVTSAEGSEKYRWPANDFGFSRRKSFPIVSGEGWGPRRNIKG